MARKNTPKTPAYPEDFIGPQEPMFLTLIPFPGFYSSNLDGDINHHADQEAEHYAEKEAGGYRGTEYPETLQPEHARITQEEFAELIFTHMDYGTLHRKLAHAYLDAFNNEAEDTLGFPIELKFESMDSPQFYNFETDRVFAHIPMRTARNLIRYTLRTPHARACLRDNIKRRHQSRSGFASFYSTDAGEWAKRARSFIHDNEDDASDMDHNHFQTFLEAAIYASLTQPNKPDKHAWSDFLHQVYSSYAEYDGIYQEWDQSMDWKGFDAACFELRTEKDEAFREANPDQPLLEAPCPDTPDLFQGKPA
jgi:hypothetical protein